MSTLRKCILSVALAGAMSSADASDWYYGVMGSYLIPDDARLLDSGPGLKVLAGVPLNPAFNAEFSVFAHQNDFDDADGDATSLGLGADLNFPGESWGRVHPFFLMGFGAQRSSLDVVDIDDDTPFLDLGLGIAGLLTEGIGLRAEIRGYQHFKVDSAPGTEDAFDLRLNLGLQFGGTAKPVAAPAPAPKPAPAPVRAPEPAPAPVAPPADSDNDGVVDTADECSGTPAGAAVDAKGCVQIEKVVLKGVSFAPGSATLKPEASDTLRSVAGAMKANDKLKVEVGGHTDSTGVAEKNQALSERRAKSVKAFLVKEGVAADRLTVKGYGQTKPVDSNDTPQGRANNRRVEFDITTGQ